MANIDQLKQIIRLAIKTNGVGEITGEVLQEVLLEMVDELAAPDIDTATSSEVVNIWNNIN